MKWGLINRSYLSPQAVHRVGSCEKSKSAWLLRCKQVAPSLVCGMAAAPAGLHPAQHSKAGCMAAGLGGKQGTHHLTRTSVSQVCYTHRYQGCSFRCRTEPWRLFLDPATNATRSPHHSPHNFSKVRHIFIQVFVVKRFHDRLLQKENSDKLVPVGQWTWGSNYHAHGNGARQQYVKKG